MREANRDKIQWEYISKDELPDGVEYDGTKKVFTITHNIKDLGIKEGDVCEIHVSAYRVGYITGNGDIEVPVVNGKPNADLTLEVVSPNTDPEKFYINQEFTLKITTSDADDVEAVQVFMDGGWEYIGVNENDVQENV
ncbi:hypothetical protein RCJ22_24650, partial [Vibrio sp. FNV 38]|nr:hypothetical protein [Vibrio sp. FNV 38]